MQIYKQSGNKLIHLKEKKFELEKIIQTLIEQNLDELFGLRFIASEFALNNFRIDTLAYDQETNSFVIIEYKRDRSFSIIDQGMTYLSLLLNNKADFILEYNEKCKTNLRKSNIDWSQSRVIFIARTFTKYQRKAIGFKNLPIELWEVKKFENNLISFNQITVSDKNESINLISKKIGIDKISKEIKQYTIEDHFKQHWNKSQSLFETLSQRILDIDPEIKIRPVKNYIGFNIKGKNVVNIKVQSSGLVLELLRVKPEDLKDPESRVHYVNKSFENWNKHVSVFKISSEYDIDYAMMLIKQVYKRFIE